MFRYLLLFSLLGSLLSMAWRAVAQQDEPAGQVTAGPAPVEIQSPVPGQALQGSISILGKNAAAGFLSAELAFTYTQDSRDTWFLIQESAEPVEQGELARWDTTTLSDGDYTLRMIVRRETGDPLTMTVPGLRVRNYTPVETDTPAADPPTSTSQPTSGPAASTAAASAQTPPLRTLTPEGTPVPERTATPLPPVPVALPPNPAQVSTAQILVSLGKGALAAVGAFAVIGLYQSVKTTIRKRSERG